MKRGVIFACCAIAFGGLLAGCQSALVGASCQEGFSLCSDECVNTRRDFRNCGRCGNTCGDFVCDDGRCSDEMRPGAKDAGDLDAAPEIPDAGISDSGAPFDPDTGLGGCLVGERQCGDDCVNTNQDRANCGSCGKSCPEGQICSGGQCSAACMGGLVQCGDSCHELMDDVEHCGVCAVSCASGICEDGTCQDAVPGQVVVIGHDFNNANDAMRRIAGNAVFLARGAPVRVLAYRGRATAAAISGVEAAINVAKREIGRDWQQTIADENNLPLQLVDADVFLIHPQSGASDVALVRLGQLWGAALAQFIARGGIIVAFEAPSETNDGTFRILEPSRIFGAMKRTEIGVQTLKVKTPGLGVALRVPDRYLSASHSVRFEGLTTGGTAIVVDAGGRPVVIQRVIVPQTP